MQPYQLLLRVTVLTTGLIAGLLYGYDCSVINGLAPLADRAYLLAFQSINTAIQQPYFFLTFMGSLILLPLSTWLAFRQKDKTGFRLLLAATLLYTAGVFGITAWGNVPLNNTLAAADIPASPEASLRQLRLSFEPAWNTLHHLRTYAAILSFLCAIMAGIKKPAIDIAGSKV